MKTYQAFSRLFFSIFLLAWAVLTTIPAMAGDLVVTRYFSGLWDQPKQ